MHGSCLWNLMWFIGSQKDLNFSMKNKANGIRGEVLAYLTSFDPGCRAARAGCVATPFPICIFFETHPNEPRGDLLFVL